MLDNRGYIVHRRLTSDTILLASLFHLVQDWERPSDTAGKAWLMCTISHEAPGGAVLATQRLAELGPHITRRCLGMGPYTLIDRLHGCHFGCNRRLNALYHNDR